MNEKYKLTGGARIGRANASYPLAYFILFLSGVMLIGLSVIKVQ